MLGSVSDTEGSFKIEKVPVGRPEALKDALHDMAKPYKIKLRKKTPLPTSNRVKRGVPLFTMM
jgi:hypothetical protein